jgi:hypothetical protein
MLAIAFDCYEHSLRAMPFSCRHLPSREHDTGSQIAPANATKRRAATYRLQVEAMHDSRRTERWRQKKLSFPVDDIDLEKWVHHNPGAWSQIKRELRMAAEARIGTPPLSPAASAAFMVSIARKHGMPHRLAILCVEMSRK